jgi:hypothetical protein
MNTGLQAELAITHAKHSTEVAAVLSEGLLRSSHCRREADNNYGSSGQAESKNRLRSFHAAHLRTHASRLVRSPDEDAYPARFKYIVDSVGNLGCEFSWICRRLAKTSTTRTSLLMPTTRPFGV